MKLANLQKNSGKMNGPQQQFTPPAIPANERKSQVCSLARSSTAGPFALEIPILQAPMAGSDSVALARSVSSTSALGRPVAPVRRARECCVTGHCWTCARVRHASVRGRLVRRGCYEASDLFVHIECFINHRNRLACAGISL